MSTPDPLTTATQALGVVKQWRELEAQERIPGADAFRSEVLTDVRDISDKTNRVLALFSPWGLETAFSGSLPDPPPFHQRFLIRLRERLGRPPAEDPPLGDSTSLPRLSVALMGAPNALGRAVEEARRYIEQVRESAAAVVPPLGPASKATLDRVLFMEERLLIHASSVKEFAKQGMSPRAGEALVEAFMLATLARSTRQYHEHLRELLTEDARDLSGAQPRRRVAKLRRRVSEAEKWRRDMTVRMLRSEADMIDEVLSQTR